MTSADEKRFIEALRASLALKNIGRHLIFSLKKLKKLKVSFRLFRMQYCIKAIDCATAQCTLFQEKSSLLWHDNYFFQHGNITDFPNIPL